MNAKSLAILSLVAAAAGSAFAETPTVVTDEFTSTRSRAEVLAELQAYRQSGVNPWSTSYNPLKGFASGTTRQQVTAGYVAARDEVAALTGEDSGSALLARGGAGHTALAGDASERDRW